MTSVPSDPLLNEKEKKMVEQRLRELLENNEGVNRSKSIIALNDYKGRFLEQGETTISAHVSIDNKSHPLYTLIEVEAPDRHGLFYDLLGALHYLEISIDLARIATEMKAAFDTFYILGADKKKLSNEEVIQELQQRLLLAAEGNKVQKK